MWYIIAKNICTFHDYNTVSTNITEFKSKFNFLNLNLPNYNNEINDFQRKMLLKYAHNQSKLTLDRHIYFSERRCHIGSIRPKPIFNQLLFKNYLLN